MSQQRGEPTGPEDDWWGQLYDDSTDDTGPTAAPDSLDDRFASASGTVTPSAPRPAAGPTPARDRPAREGDRPPSTAAGPPSAGRDSPPAGAEPPWWEAPPPPGVPGPRPAGPAPAGEPPAAGDVPRSGGVPGSGGSSGAGGPGRPGEAPSSGGPPPGAARAPYAGDATGSGPLPGADGESPAADRAPSAGGNAAWGGGTPRSRDGHAPGAGGVFGSGPARGAPWEPAPRGPAGPAGTGPYGARPWSQPQAPGPAPAAPPEAPGAPGKAGATGRREDPRGRTASGTGPADLTEPPGAALPPPPPPRTAPNLPPLPHPFLPSLPPSEPDYVGSGPPTYDAEPTALPPAGPDGLDAPVADTALDGAQYGTWTLRAASVRGDSARYRGEPRRDALLVARFGAGEQALILVAMANGARSSAGAHRAAAEILQWTGRAVARSHARLAEDLRAGWRGELKSGLHRLTDRGLGRLRAGAAEQGLSPDEYAATLRCLLLPADPASRTRVFFGVGPGGLLRLRDGVWQDLEPHPEPHPGGVTRNGDDAPGGTPEGDHLTLGLGVTTPPGPYEGPPAVPPREPFRFTASLARPGDVLLMCTEGLAEPLRSEPELGELLARRWAGRPPPGLAEFLADGRVRVKGYADDRTTAAVWEA